MNNIRNFWSNKSGAAAIEFSFWLIFIAVPLLNSLDFALYNIARSRLASSVSEASSLAFNERVTADSALVNRLDSIIRTGFKGDPSDITITITCNGSSMCTDDARPNSCFSGFDTGTGNPNFTSSGSGSECSNGTLPGYYMTLKVVAKYEEVVSGLVSPPDTFEKLITIKLE